MNNEPYTNRELDHIFADLKSDLTTIIQQTTKTNGRVTKLEKWQWTTLGGMAVITALVLPLCFYMLAKFNERVDKIETVFNNYDIEIQK